MKLPLTPSESDAIFAELAEGLGHQASGPREWPLTLHPNSIYHVLLGAKPALRFPVEPQPRFNGHEWFWNIDNYAQSRTQTGWLGAYGDHASFMHDLAKHIPAAPRQESTLRVGDTLWVREKHEFYKPRLNWLKNDERIDTEGRVKFFVGTDQRGQYYAFKQALDYNPVYNKVRSATQLPRFASRIDLQVASIRVERLHDITAEAIREAGITGERIYRYKDWSYILGDGSEATARLCYQNWWNHLHPDYLWETNPFVFVVDVTPTKLPPIFAD